MKTIYVRFCIIIAALMIFLSTNDNINDIINIGDIGRFILILIMLILIFILIKKDNQKTK